MIKSKKAFAALAITAAVGFSSVIPFNVLQVSAAANFMDIDGAAAPYKTAIEEMAKQNVISGFSDTQFKPNQNVTRAELAKIVTLALHVDQNQAKKNTFTDVADSAWYASYVTAMVNAGAMKGEGTSFSPNNSVTHEQLVEIVASVLKVDTSKVKGLMGTAFATGKLASRGEVAMLVHAAQQLAPVQVTSIKNLNAITLQVTFSAPLPKEDIDVDKAKQNFVFDNGLTVLNIPQLKSGATATYIVPVSPQKAGTKYSLSYKGQAAGTFEANTEKLALRSGQQVSYDTFEIESSLEDGVADYGYVVAAYSAARKGAFVVDDNNMNNGKSYKILSSMRDKQVYITPEGGETMTASYVLFTQATDGRQAPKFRLPNGEVFKPGVKYTVTSDWATLANPTFTAKEIGPLAIQSAQQVSETSLDVTLAQDPKDELFAVRSITLTPLNGAPLTAQYKLTSRKGATGTFDIQNGGKLVPGTTYTVAPQGKWATANAVTVTAK
ncbi:S-layer homology domain-containing protein [Paenibacillus radicis (ex Xue et al. 2023)]|uniref:S-layer homology domain-containing protein n=1 Tax=Paenibacillus radicis (ex Xue et al. 2023) TaxID=2972489 RepID=A0ABT1YRZ0_9BACL|nr:S-layer homology domain-containing protein [Paenibacillus radicis (ex Xue et al. 2023)]MCR8634755.1 S-layer homology domain-containing protein [Paenibacillus radicis (ex Xue et al. 2023)]